MKKKKRAKIAKAELRKDINSLRGTVARQAASLKAVYTHMSDLEHRVTQAHVQIRSMQLKVESVSKAQAVVNAPIIEAEKIVARAEEAVERMRQVESNARYALLSIFNKRDELEGN